MFTQHFVQNCSQLEILRHVRAEEWYVSKDISSWYMYYVYFMLTHEQWNSSVVQIPAETIFIFNIV